MRILISFEKSYQVYGEALESTLRGLRPDAEVVAWLLAGISEQVESFDPHLVVSSRPNTVDPGGRAAWYQLSAEPDEPSESCLDGWRFRRNNPGLEELLSFIDEMEGLVRSGGDLGGC